MKHSYLKGLSIFLAFGLFTFNACQKDRTTIDTDQQAAKDNAQAEFMFNDVNNIVDDAARSQGGVNKTEGIGDLDACIVKTVDTLGDASSNYFPRRITLNYSGCSVNSDQRKRKGIIKMTFTKPYRESGAEVTIEMVDFSINDFKVEGTVSLKNNGIGTDGKQSFTKTVTGGKVTNPTTGKSILFNTTQTRTILDDKGTPYIISDDSVSFTGNGSGTSSDGKTFTATVTEPLILSRTFCKYIVKGKAELKPEGKETRNLDFGNGSCDNKIAVTIGKNTFNIEQP